MSAQETPSATILTLLPHCKKFRVNPSILKMDTIFQSGLLVPTMIPFVAPFPKLCFEVGLRCNFDTRTLHDMDGRKIMDFSPEGVEKRFHIPNHGEVYTLRQSYEFYLQQKSPGTMIKQWLSQDRKDLKGKALSNPKRTNFYPTVSCLICMLCCITGQKDDSKFEHSFARFIDRICPGRPIRCGQVLSDALAQQLEDINL